MVWNVPLPQSKALRQGDGARQVLRCEANGSEPRRKGVFLRIQQDTGGSRACCAIYKDSNARGSQKMKDRRNFRRAQPRRGQA